MHACRRLVSLPCLGRLAGLLYLDPVFLALLPPVALTFDYSMTFVLAKGHEYVIASEASPVIRFALENNLMVAYYLALLVLYFLVTLGILRFLRKTPYYQFGVLFVFLISLAHVCGGMTWVLRSEVFSLAVTLLFMVCFMFSMAVVLWTTVTSLHAGPPRKGSGEGNTGDPGRGGIPGGQDEYI